jgi:regulator of sirC expression with transglutaminase-like and TPR domain
LEYDEWQKAKADYTRIISMDPEDADAFKSRGRVNEKMGLEKEAQQDFDAYEQIQPQTADQYFRRVVPVSEVAR